MRMTRSLRRFVFVYLVLHLLAILVFLAVLSPWLQNQLLSQTQLRMFNVAIVLREQLRQSRTSLDQPNLQERLRPVALETGLAITLLSADGTVLTSTPDDEGPDGAPRPEIRGAAVNHFGIDRRVDAETGQRKVYLAVAYPGGGSESIEGFISLGLNEQNVLLLNTRLRQFLWLFTLSLAALAAMAMWSFATRELEPMRDFSIAAQRIAAGQYDSVPTVLDRNDEWRDLGVAFRQMQTELALRESRLAENSQRLEAVLSSMIEGVIAINSVGTVMLANQAACEMLGVNQAHLLGRKLLELVRIPQLRQAIENTQLNRVFGSVEFQTFDTPRKTISARVAILSDTKHPGVTVVLHDITDLRQLENVRRDFVANVSHELKTPLASIKAYTETLLLGAINDPENNLPFVQQIENQANLLNEQIMDLLQLAKMESGQALLEIVSVPLDEICRDAVRLHAAEANARHVKLTFEDSAEKVFARADREALMTIVDNLVTNAIRYTPAGGQVTISADRENELAVVTVADTGIGIAHEHQSRIFERFYRVDRARSRDLGGTGLGLSIVKHLTQALGGAVHLVSKVGKGSTFRIKLPLAKRPST